jgi:hypothetical protein
MVLMIVIANQILQNIEVILNPAKASIERRTNPMPARLLLDRALDDS